MTEKRFVDDGFEAIEEQSFTDTLTNKTYYVDYFDEIIELCNNLNEENEQLKKLLECSREEANDYCEELMGKDEFIRLYKRIGDELKEENEQLKHDIKNLEITIEARETLIDVCEKKFRELGLIITVDDDGYVIE